MSLTLDAVLIGLTHLDSAIDAVAKLIDQAPSKEGLAAELSKRGERLITLSVQVAAAQAEDRRLLDARIPKVTP